MELGDLGQVFPAVSALQARGNLQPLGFGQLVDFHEFLEAGGIDATGLFHEDVLAGSNGSRVMEGAEARRGRQDDAVHPGVNRLPVGVEADENAFVGQVKLVLQSSRFLTQVWARSVKTSARATIFTFLLELRQSLAAPVPRPPQPIRAIFNTSLPATLADRAIFTPAASVSRPQPGWPYP